LTEAGYVPKVPVQAIEFADASKREQWINEKGMQVFSMYQPGNPLLTIDLFVNFTRKFSRYFFYVELAGGILLILIGILLITGNMSRISSFLSF